MIHTRAYLLLERDYKEYEEAQLFGIFVTPVEDSLLEWIAEIKGLKDSLWEGAELQLSLKYTERYDGVPPRVNFTTIPFHPNVDPYSGRPCLDFLDDPTKWDPNLSLTNILLSIQVLLSNPVLTNAVNLEAAKMLRNNYALYRERVIQCVKASQHLEDIPSAFGSPIKYYPISKEYSPDLMRMLTTISYEDYYMTWTKIATSKAAEHFETPVFEDPDFIGNSYDWLATNVAKDEWNRNMYHFVSEFIEKQKKLQLLTSEGVVHHTPSPTPVSTSHIATEEHAEHQGKHLEEAEESWEKEAEELVLWSTKLDETSWD
ncbi:ubiquitin-conjugating enzyme E2 U [Tiliqua scincoides]|uniref:ubiquitin-conjugating enzyme E2 U n=1 Tax=Tiliqua scincoides TaxID=71010 RepID=UPI0034630E9A